MYLKKSKKIELCDQNKKIRYSFGNEITLLVDRNKVSTNPWHGMGSDISYSILIPNREYKYEVFFSAERLSERHKIYSGINVTKDDKILKTVECKERGLKNNIVDTNFGNDLSSPAR